MSKSTVKSRVAPPGISWEKVKDEEDHGPDSGLFKQRKAVSRNSNVRSPKCRERSGKDGESVKSQSARRPNTTLGFEEYFDDTEGSKKLKSLNAKASLQELKKSTLWHQNMPPRNCVSALGNKHDATRAHRSGHATVRQYSEDEKSDDLDFTEKMKAFRALISPKPRTSRHDVSNEQLKRARSFSDGIEKVGNHVKFNAESSDQNEIRASTPARLLNEFQLTYEQDRDRSRSSSRIDNGIIDYDDDTSLNVVAGNLNYSAKHRSIMIDHGHERKLDEFQLTYEHDRERAKLANKGYFDRQRHSSRDTQISPSERAVYDLSKTESQLFGMEDSENHDHSQTVSFRKDIKRVIKRPTNIGKFGEYSAHRDLVENRDHHSERSSSVNSEIMKYTGFDDIQRTHLYHSRAHSITPTHVLYEDHIRSERRSERPHSTALAESYALHQGKYSPSDRSQSVTPTSGSIHASLGKTSMKSGSMSDLGVPGQESSLRAHLNILGASLSSLSSRLNSGSESDVRSVGADSERSMISSSGVKNGVRSGRGDDLMMRGDRKARQSGNATFDVSGVKVKVRDGHNLQTWSSASDIRSIPANEGSRLSKHSSVSGSVIAGSTRSSRSSSCETWKQTNVKEYEGDDSHSFVSSSHNDTLTSEGGRVSHLVESLRQTDMLGTVEPGSGRREKLAKAVKYISRHRDTLGHLKREESSPDGATDKRSRRGRRTERKLPHGIKESNGANHFSDTDSKESASDSDNDDDLTFKEEEYVSLTENSETAKTHSRRLKRDKDDLSQRQSSGSTKIIFRKTPLKAVHSRSPETNKTDRGKHEKNNISDSHYVEGKSNKNDAQKSKMKVSRPSSNDDDKKKRILVKRPQGSSEDHTKPNGERVDNQQMSQKAQVLAGRSKSALGMTSSSTELRNSPLPSKKSLQEFKSKQRPHSSLDTLSSSHKTHLHRESLRSHQSNTEGKKGAVLKQKVLKLHEEVDQRLNSMENAAHNRSKHDLKMRDSDLEDASGSEELSDASTIINDSEDDENGEFGDMRKYSTHRITSKKKSSSSFITSTPLKELAKNRQTHGDLVRSLSGSSKDLEGNIRLIKDSPIDANDDYSDHEQLDGDSRKKSRKLQDSAYLAKNLKQIIEARKRMTPDFTKMKSERRTDVDEDADDDDLDPNPRRRSGSVGSRQRSESNKKDILSRLLSKMTESHLNDSLSSTSSTTAAQYVNGHSNGRKWILQSNGISIHGRASPAESLINHLDNPNIVKLLQKLYKADPETRRVIMTKVQYFKAWQLYAVESREHRIRKEAWIKEADTFCVQRQLLFHFVTWKQRAKHSRNMRCASALFRRHMLTKGFKALCWSISQSRHQSQKLQARVHGIMLKVTFQKWRTKALTQRRERIESATRRWRQYVMETQKIRHMQKVMDANIMMETFRCWTKRYQRRLRLNMAFSFLRRTLLKHAITLWCDFVAQCKEKKEKHAAAVSQHQHNLLKSTFFTMVVSYKKSRKARSHFKSHRLSEVFWAWKQASQTCRIERQADMAASRQHWEKQRLKLSFVHWQEKLKICRAVRKSNYNVTKSAFVIWRQALQRNLAHRAAIESTVMRNKLHRALLTWRQNVVQLKRRQKMAVALIENCHMKQTFRAWRLYTALRQILKKKALLHRIAYQRKSLVSCFSLWCEAFRQRREEQHARQLWSQDCARKLASHWRLICHKRLLARLLEATQPERDQRLLKGNVYSLVYLLERRHKENDEAEDMLKILQRRQLWHKFQYWRAETRRALLIKPMVLSREKQRITECFESWHSYVKQKSICKQRKEAFELETLRKSFSSWRRQYQACQIEKQIKTRISNGLLSCFWEEWRFLILRKKKGQEFRDGQLLQRMFYYWRGRATTQFTHRARMEEEEENNMELKRHFFTLWRENAQLQASNNDLCVIQFVDRQSQTKLVTAFVTWRRHMHSTLIARAYQKTQNQRLLLTLFLAWRDASDSSVTEAVHKFSERIGLSVEKSRVSVPSSGIGDSEDYDILYDENESNKSLMSSFSSSFSIGSSARRLFGEKDQSLDTDADRMILLSGGLQASVDDHQAKCQRLKETVARAINRLQHWPVCVAFEQWRDFTTMQRQLKTASEQLRKLHATTEMTVAFKIWKSNYFGAKTAREHWNARQMSQAFENLRFYKDHRKVVKHLSQVAHQHRMLTVFRKYFPPWLQKTQEQRQEKHILHLWTSRTAREMELLPLENQLTQKLGQRSLTLCFSLWLVKYRAVSKLRSVYQDNLLTWVFTAWREWARERHSLKSKSQQLLHQRRTKMAFRMWCERLRLSKEVERRYHQAWQNYQLLILQEWRVWTKASHKLQQCQKVYEIQQSRRSLSSYFTRWKTLAAKVKEIRSNQTQKLLYSVFVGWRQTVRHITGEKKKVLQFQVHSYTLLVQRLFHQWHATYMARQRLHQEKQQYAEQCALAMAAIWKKKAQKTRGQRLQVLVQQRKVASYFHHWRESLASVQSLYDKLEIWQQQKNGGMLRQYLRTWRTQLIADHARKVYISRVLFTIITEWKACAKVNKERRIRGLALKKALEERSLHVYFRYWMATTRVKQSVQQNIETRLQIRILRSWRHYTRNMRYLRDLQAHFTQRVNMRILHGAFMNLRWRAEYCVSLQEMADKVVKDRERATMRAVMVMWKDRLDLILAARCYGHILASRVARQWQRFVYTRKSERQRDQDNWNRAVLCHQRSICKKVLAALKTEVQVTHHVEKRRQRLCNKYASVWKLRVDMSVTAVVMEDDLALRRTWNKWRMEYAKLRSAKRVAQLHDRQCITQVFNAWRKISCKNFSRATPIPVNQSDHRRTSTSSLTSGSMLPVPISQTRSPSVSSPTPSAANMSFGFRGGRRN